MNGGCINIPGVGGQARGAGGTSNDTAGGAIPNLTGGEKNKRKKGNKMAFFFNIIFHEQQHIQPRWRSLLVNVSFKYSKYECIKMRVLLEEFSIR